MFVFFLSNVDHFLKKSLSWVCYNIASLFYVLVFWLRGLWDLSSPTTRDRTRTLGTGRQSLNHWTAREVPRSYTKVAEFEKKFDSLNKVQSPNTHSLFCPVPAQTYAWAPLCIFLIFRFPSSLEIFFLVRFHLNGNFQHCKGKPLPRHLICISSQDIAYKKAKLCQHLHIGPALHFSSCVSQYSKTSLKPAKCSPRPRRRGEGKTCLCLQTNSMWNKTHKINVSGCAAKSEQNVNFE